MRWNQRAASALIWGNLAGPHLEVGPLHPLAYQSVIQLLASDNYQWCCTQPLQVLKTNNHPGVSASCYQKPARSRDLFLAVGWLWSGGGTDMKAISSSDLATSWLFSTEFVKLWLWSAEMFGSNNFEFDLKMQPHLSPSTQKKKINKK